MVKYHCHGSIDVCFLFFDVINKFKKNYILPTYKARALKVIGGHLTTEMISSGRIQDIMWKICISAKLNKEHDS